MNETTEENIRGSVVFPEELDGAIDVLVEEGVYASRSEFFRHSAAVNLLAMAAGANAMQGILRESADLKEARIAADKLGHQQFADLAVRLMEE